MDLRPAVRAAQHRGAAYYRTDAGWSVLGAFCVTRSLIREVRKIDPSIRKLSGGDLRLREVTNHLGSLGDLALAGAVGSQFVMSRIEPAREIVLDADPAGYQSSEMSPDERLVECGIEALTLITNDRAPTDGGVMVVGGEDAGPVGRWVGECAARTTIVLNRTVPTDAVAIERPRVVVHIVQEQALLDE